MGPALLNMDFNLPADWSNIITFFNFILLAGIIAATYFVPAILGSVWKGLYSPYIGQLLGHGVDLRKQGRWAVVTGATDGIGKAYARELARLGLDVFLISRTLEKLKSVAQEIEDDFKVKTKVLAVDFTGGPEIYDAIRKELEDLDTGILVNNVGISYAYPEYLTELPEGDSAVFRMINCNCVSCTMMCRIVVPGMVKRKKGVILNLSSGGSVLPLPLLSMYAASKVYVDFLTQSLQLEYKQYGLTIQSVVPFYVATNMSKVRKPTLTVPSPTDYVRYQLKTIGLEERTYGYSWHKLQGWSLEMLREYVPKFMYVPMWSAMMFKTRSRYLEKKQRYRKAQ